MDQAAGMDIDRAADAPGSAEEARRPSSPAEDRI
jgi:hypothetical protein